MNVRRVYDCLCVRRRITNVLRGAEEACWAHNPKVLGSKPSGAIFLFLSPWPKDRLPNLSERV